MPFLSRDPFIPHTYEEIREGVLPSAPTPEAYQSWINKFQRNESAETFRVEYNSGGHRVAGLLMQPRNAAGCPLVVFNRGGRGRYGMLNVLTLNNLITPLVERGYLVLAAQYRGVDGGEGEDEFGGDEVNDILALLEEGRKLPQWDGRNAHFFGWSRGGMMTLLALKHGAEVNAAALGAPLVDLTLSTGEHGRGEEWLKRVLPDYEQEGFRALEMRSAPYWLPKLRGTPLLLMHGDADADVSILHSRHLAGRLKERGHPHRIIEYPGGNHYLNQQRIEVLDEVHHWFQQHSR